MNKAQADIVSAAIIVLIALGLTTTALMWGLPLIQKRQDSAMVARVNHLITQDLIQKIKYVANTGGSEVFTINAGGVWSIDEGKNMLSFTFFSKATDKATGLWIGGGECQPNGFNGQSGILGLNEPCVVCTRADSMGDGYNITYQIGCRELWNTDHTKGLKIQLKSAGITTSTSKTIKISQRAITPDTLIIIDVEILL
ncbi:MAG: hypothetical protein QW040_02215 [Candidatus Aenigmatarchaeota archaeon]